MSRKPTELLAAPSLRPLLPAHPQSRGPELPQRHFEFKRKRQSAACEPCREHKTKCDGNRPGCTACLRRGTECKFEAEPKETHFQALRRKFDSLQGEASSLQQVYDLLRTRPEGEALSIFRKIRDGESHESILQFVHHGDLLLQFSLTSATSPSIGGFSNSAAPTSPSYSEPQSPEPDKAGSRRHSSTASTESHIPQPSSARRNSTASAFDQYVGCRVVEPLLDQVQPSRWTTVSADDEMMRGLLSQYFQLQYRGGSIFHKDYFLQDMLSGDQTHCSPLLVNAVLASALDATQNAINRHRYWEPGGSPDCEFFAEAKKFWDAEQNSGQARLTTVQAGLLLSVLHGLDSLGSAGWKCLAQSIEMAAGLGLFDTDLHPADDPSLAHARAYTAWSAFCWQSLWCYRSFMPPLVRQAPAFPLPDPQKYPEWYGEINVKYPNADHISATGHGYLFKAKADFSTTLNAISHRCSAV